MNKIKTFALCAAYIVLAIISLPMVIIALICALIVYGAIKLEAIIIERLDDEELTDAWNTAANAYCDCAKSANEVFLMEIEL